jgi:halogenation protein CepH
MGTHYDYDMIVIGGGPAGSTVATFVAMQGRRVLLIEKERFPRYQIGESLLPATIHTICSMLGVKEELERSTFVRKPGGAFRWGRNSEVWYFLFGVALKKEDTGFAYQVERSKFDHILLNNAKRKGVTVWEGQSAFDTITENGRVCGVLYGEASGAKQEIRARFVVDASGNTTRFSRRVGERVYSEFFRNIALFCYFNDGKRLPPPYSGTTLSAAFKEGWFWYIPLSNQLTSVGAVVARECIDKVKADPQATMKDFINSCPVVRDLLSSATRVTEGQYGQFRIRKDWSYCTSRFWIPGMVLVGDAACFVDPVISSGVHLATYSALLAARSINTCLSGTLDEKTCFKEYSLRYRREYSNFYQFLMHFYRMDQEEDEYFWAAREVLQAGERANEAFVRLVSGVTDKGEPPYTTADEVFEARRNAANLVLQAGEAGITGKHDLEADLERQLKPELDDIFRFDDVFQSLEAGETKRHRQLFKDGLVPSPDELHWVRA